MAEKLTLEQRLQKSRAVDCDKGGVRARARAVDAAGTSSFPVPVSPSIKTGIEESAAASMSRKTSAMARLTAMISAKRSRCKRSRRSAPTWAWSCWAA
jgi:hypothetical protein